MIYQHLIKIEKKKYFKKKKIIFVVNSNWMRKMAQKSLILRDQKIHTFFASFDLKKLLL